MSSSVINADPFYIDKSRDLGFLFRKEAKDPIG